MTPLPQPRRGARRDPLPEPVERWWECGLGASTAWVVADTAEEARARAEALLRDLGALPGGPPGLHDSYLRMREFATRDRR
jgi:hypothetical protein